jgi:AraC family transcriptional regulator
MGMEANGAAPDRIETNRAFAIVGIAETYTPETRHRISEQWDRFVAFPVARATSGDAYGVVLDGSTTGFRYMTGVEAGGTAAPSGFERLDVAAPRFAVFRHDGSVATLRDTIDRALGGWLPRSGEKAAANPVLIERYGPGFDPKTMSGDIEIWVPLA